MGVLVLNTVTVLFCKASTIFTKIMFIQSSWLPVGRSCMSNLLPAERKARVSLQCWLTSICTCRGYLARGVLFRGAGRQGDAERMFLQARYIAPKESRALVDRVIGPG